MTLSITPSEIKINNAAGQKIFNGDEGLLFQKSSYSSQLSWPQIDVKIENQKKIITHNLSLDSSDIPIVFLTITNSTGLNIASSFNNLRLPFNSNININQYSHASGGYRTFYDTFICQVLLKNTIELLVTTPRGQRQARDSDWTGLLTGATADLQLPASNIPVYFNYNEYLNKLNTLDHLHRLGDNASMNLKLEILVYRHKPV
jgi:hypothetical protein